MTSGLVRQRIVHVANFVGPRSGGLRTAMEEIGQRYVLAGHDVVHVVPGVVDDDFVTPYGRRITVAASVLPRSGGYRVITNLDRMCILLDELAPDRLEVSDRTTLRGLGWWAKGSGVPSVMWAHERIDGVVRAFLPGPWPARWMADRWNSTTAPRFDRVVCTTDFAAGEFRRIGWPHVEHVPLGVDLDLFTPARFSTRLRADLLGPGLDVLLVLCSRLSREKRPQDAVTALVGLRRAGVRARLVVMGSGPMEPWFLRQSRRLPITLLGHVSRREEVAQVLACADVCIAPGPIETFGLAALEALASGTPVVAARGGAVEEVLVPGAGIATNRDNYAQAVCELLSPDAPGIARGRAEQFPWSRSVAGMLALHDLEPVTAG